MEISIRIMFFLLRTNPSIPITKRMIDRFMRFKKIAPLVANCKFVLVYLAVAQQKKNINKTKLSNVIRFSSFVMSGALIKLALLQPF